MNLIEIFQPTVDRLILQYQEYLSLSSKLKELENDKLALAAEEAKKHGQSIVSILQNPDQSDELKRISNLIMLFELDLQRTSDEMSFANHLVWLMYKYQAYKGSATEIATVGDLRKHCSPEDYICTKRFRFLRSEIMKNFSIDVIDENEFPDSMPLEEFIGHNAIATLLDDENFLKEWKSYEYYVDNNKIAKWQNFVGEQGLA